MIRDGSLETARLAVRPFRPADAGDLVALFADPLVARYVDDGGPLDAATAALWVRRSTENLARHGFGTGAVVLRGGERLIGWAGFARPPDAPEELVYGLARAYWRQGLGLELVTALVAFAEARGMMPQRATVHARNVASAALLERAGFRLAATRHGGDPLTNLFLRGAA